MINICIIATIVIYLVGMLLVGFVYSKSNEDSSDFYLGGRTMGPLVTAMSAEASDMSSWLLMGMPGLAYLTGIASPGWTAIGLAVGTWLNWLIVARRLRRYSANLDAITVPQFLSLRFHDQRNLLNALGAVIIIVFFIPYTASGFAACGKLFNSLFGVDYMAAMILSAVVIVGYTIMGGFRAVSTTDLIQSVVMSMALIAVLVYGVSVAGGWDVVLDNARSLPGYLTMAASHNAADNTATSYSLLDIASTLAWGLGYFGMPHILLRFMAIEDEKKLVLSRRIASVWVVIAMTASIAIGMVFAAMFNIVGSFYGTENEIIVTAGIINNIIEFFGGEPVNWINYGSSYAANITVMIIYIVWNALPFKILILLGGLQSVNRQYYDAARVDGTSRRRIFTRITVPLLSPMIAYVVITGFIDGFKEYTSIIGIFGETMGPPDAAGRLNTMVGFIYDALATNNQGRASAAALILFAIILVVTLLNLQVSKKRVHF